MEKAKTIITYLMNGTTSGPRTIEFSNKLIKGIVVPRKDLQSLINERKELQQSGVYFLVREHKEDECQEENEVYIGQATSLGKRLLEHYKDTRKDFWNIAIAFTYKDSTLDTSDINYLEKALITEARRVGRYKIHNGTSGNKGLLQEYRLPDMQEFIEDLKVLLVSLGFLVLDKLVKTEQLTNEDDIYYLETKGSKAIALYTEAGFIVLKGSTGPWEMQESVIKRHSYAFRNRPKLLEKGIIKQKGEEIVFMKDWTFPTPSSAADLIGGGNFNGRDVRKNREKKKLREVIEREGKN